MAKLESWKSRDRPKVTRMDRIQNMMVQKGMAEEDWKDRDNWGLKIF